MMMRGIGLYEEFDRIILKGNPPDPSNLPKGLMLGCVTEREDPADALVVNKKNEKYQLTLHQF